MINFIKINSTDTAYIQTYDYYVGPKPVTVVIEKHHTALARRSWTFDFYTVKEAIKFLNDKGFNQN